MIKLVVGAVAVVGVGIMLIGTYLSPDDLSRCGERPSSEARCQKADAIVAVSGGKTQVRAAEAIQLFKDGWADVLIFSGAAQDTSGPSNAQVMRQQALEAGVPSSQIVTEDLSRTTHQNAAETDKLVQKYHISRLIVVTSPYHQRRAGLEFQKIFDGRVQVINHPASGDPDWPALWWMTPSGWWLAGGELVKIGAVQSGNSQ